MGRHRKFKVWGARSAEDRVWVLPTGNTPSPPGRHLGGANFFVLWPQNGIFWWIILTLVHTYYTVPQKNCASASFWITPWNIGQLQQLLACNITKKRDVNDHSLVHFTLILLLHYVVKCRNHSLTVYNNEFILGRACRLGKALWDHKIIENLLLT